MNAYFLKEVTKYQPISENIKVTKNSLRYRGIDGFIAAVSPFNFTAIGGNLSYTPALMVRLANGWKYQLTKQPPSIFAGKRRAVEALGHCHAVQLDYFQDYARSGVPDGVVNFVPADGPVFGDTITASPHLAGINFTGSVP